MTRHRTAAPQTLSKPASKALVGGVGTKNSAPPSLELAAGILGPDKGELSGVDLAPAQLAVETFFARPEEPRKCGR